MFAYIQIIKDGTSASYGYSNFSFSNGSLLIKPLRGMKRSITERIPVDKITDVTENKFWGWNQIKFTYNNTQFMFLYSGFGEFNYLKENLMATTLV